jgi:hypothetical protein
MDAPGSGLACAISLPLDGVSVSILTRGSGPPPHSPLVSVFRRTCIPLVVPLLDSSPVLCFGLPGDIICLRRAVEPGFVGGVMAVSRCGGRRFSFRPYGSCDSPLTCGLCFGLGRGAHGEDFGSTISTSFCPASLSPTPMKRRNAPVHDELSICMQVVRDGLL